MDFFRADNNFWWLRRPMADVLDLYSISFNLKILLTTFPRQYCIQGMHFFNQTIHLTLFFTNLAT